MLQLAVHFYEKGHYPTDQPAMPGSKRKLKMPGYQVSKSSYQILRTLIPDLVTDIPRSRIVEYRYIQVDDAVQQQSYYFLLPITEAQLPQLEAITKTERRPGVYLWRDDQWWSFPQLETYTDGEMETYTITVKDYGTLSALNTAQPLDVHTETRQIEKTKIRVRETYEASKGPGFLLAVSRPQPNEALSGSVRGLLQVGMRDQTAIPVLTTKITDLLIANEQDVRTAASYNRGGLLGNLQRRIVQYMGEHCGDDAFADAHSEPHELAQDILRAWQAREQSNLTGFPTSISGNGMVLEWKRGYKDAYPCWWLRDEQRVSKAQSATYRHYAAIKSVPHTRWSKTFGAWYFTGGQQPPQRWLELVGYGSTPAMPPQLAQQIEDVLAQDEKQPLELIPLNLVESNYGRYEWRYGNPDVWCKLYNRTEQWMLFVANASLTERSLYGYKLQLAGDLSSEGQPNQIISGEWVHLSIPDLDSDTTQRDPNFIRQSLYQAVRDMAHLANNELPDEVLVRLAIPSDAECRRLAFQERQREIAAELEAERALAAAMKPYHEYQALLKMQQHFAETYQRVTHCKALPTLATPPLDDPWS